MFVSVRSHNSICVLCAVCISTRTWTRHRSHRAKTFAFAAIDSVSVLCALRCAQGTQRFIWASRQRHEDCAAIKTGIYNYLSSTVICYKSLSRDALSIATISTGRRCFYDSGRVHWGRVGGWHTEPIDIFIELKTFYWVVFCVCTQIHPPNMAANGGRTF